MNRLFAAALAIVCCAGCSSTGTMRKIMGSWVGYPVTDVAKQWGFPDQEREFEGKKLYTWSRYGLGNVTTNNGGNVLSCVRTFQVDGAGVIQTYDWRGNNCPVMTVTKYKDWYNPKNLPR